MARLSTNPFRWASLRGFNQRDTPQSLPDDIGTVCSNVELLDGSLGRRRPTLAAVSLTSGPSEQIRHLHVHVTSTAEELWAFSGTTVAAVHRYVSGTWSTVTGTWDTPTSASTFNPFAASFNNKLYLAFDNAENRLHVWDGTTVRRVGILKSDAPTVANTGAGAYAATARYYRVAWRLKSGSTVLATSELSDAVSFTPSGAGTAARVTKPTTPDSATHWVVYGLLGSVGDTYDLYEELTEIAVGTTTYDDSTNPSSYDGDAPMKLGINVPPPSCRYLLATDNRILMAGVFETSADTGETDPLNDRVYFTRVLGTSDQGDDESIPNTSEQKNWVDVGRNDGDDIVGLAGPVDGIVYVFKRRSIWRLVPTSVDTAPYRAERVTPALGARTVLVTHTGHFNQRNIVTAEDDFGQPVIYFTTLVGAYRISPAYGVEYVGWDITDPDTGLGPSLQAGCYVSSRRQVWWLDVDSAKAWVFTPRLAKRTEQGWRGGWATYTFTHLSLEAVTAMVDSSVVSGSLVVPILGGRVVTTNAAAIYQMSTTSTSDGGTAFTATITSKPFLFGGGWQNVSAAPPVVEATAESSATPTIAYIVDHARETRSGTTSALTADGSETRKAVAAEAVEAADAQAIAIQVTWDSDQRKTVDAVTVPFRVQEART
jgi:hypothetical protein